MDEGSGPDVHHQHGRVEWGGYVLNDMDLVGVVVCSLSAGVLGALTFWDLIDGRWILAAAAGGTSLLCLWIVWSMCRRAWRTVWL